MGYFSANVGEVSGLNDFLWLKLLREKSWGGGGFGDWMIFGLDEIMYFPSLSGEINKTQKNGRTRKTFSLS